MEPVGAYRGGGRVSITLIRREFCQNDDGVGDEKDAMISVTAVRSMVAFAPALKTTPQGDCQDIFDILFVALDLAPTSSFNDGTEQWLFGTQRSMSSEYRRSLLLVAINVSAMA